MYTFSSYFHPVAADFGCFHFFFQLTRDSHSLSSAQQLLEELELPKTITFCQFSV